VAGIVLVAAAGNSRVAAVAVSNHCPVGRAGHNFQTYFHLIFFIQCSKFLDMRFIFIAKISNLRFNIYFQFSYQLNSQFAGIPHVIIPMA
jgi:hypothetical protein